jgi:hypothetical protein
MPLKKLLFKSGVNRENTRYTTEGGWYECDKVRFRQGTPEKIGGWQRISDSQYLGVCRSLWPWSVYIGVGTNLKYYVQFSGAYYDITPIRTTTAAGAVTFAATTGSPIITVTNTAHGGITGDFVTFSGAVSLGGAGAAITAAVLNKEYSITSILTPDTYTITAAVNATSADSGNGGGSTVAAYQVNVGAAIQLPAIGWGAGGWGAGGWGIGEVGANSSLRIWNAYNFGADLIYGPNGGALYYWPAASGTSSRGVLLSSRPSASDVPLMADNILVSDASRFVLAFGVNDYGSATKSPMLIRWSDQESAVNWTPAPTNQAGSLQLSHGSSIQAVAQVRQEILIWTDTSMYSLQYLGAPIVWGSQLLADNISIVSDRAWATASGVTYWMGDEKFYKYSGRTETLNCDLRASVFGNFNFGQLQQVFASTVEQFNEIWWFYCTADSNTINRYVVYNYLENVWYDGTLARTAWVDDSVVSSVPVSADYNGRLIYQETGIDDNAALTPAPIAAYITSSEFDIDDGHNFGFVWRVLPDINFRSSTASSPNVTMTLLPLQNSGSGYNNPQSVGGSSSGTVTRTATVPVDQFTGQINIRVRGRQMAFKVESSALGVQWQLGAPRLDIKPDGRR